VITIPMVTEWNICTPDLFRFMNRQYVESFFADGSLRLSSFASFHAHSDEQRLDQNEGRTFFVHRTQQNGGQTITAWATQGLDAYVLCASMRCEEALMRSFGCDSYLRITNSTSFGMAVARNIPGLVAAFEGPCLYQNNKIIERDLGYVDVSQIAKAGAPEAEIRKRFADMILPKMKHYPLFLKDMSFAHQAEYRFVWLVNSEPAKYLDIKVPEAVPFCAQPNGLTI